MAGWWDFHESWVGDGWGFSNPNSTTQVCDHNQLTLLACWLVNLIDFWED